MAQKTNPMDEETKREEEAALQIPKEEEIRASIVSEYGFDETADKERIDKLVAKEIEHGKKLSSAIGQKIKHRTEAEDLKKKVQPAAVEQKDDLSQKDLYALIQAKVPESDIDDVVEYAKFKKIPVADALKSSVIKTMLAEKEDFRVTAAAANAGGGRRVVAKATDESLLEELSKGNVPEKGSEEAERLFWARRGVKK